MLRTELPPVPASTPATSWCQHQFSVGQPKIFTLECVNEPLIIHVKNSRTYVSHLESPPRHHHQPIRFSERVCPKRPFVDFQRAAAKDVHVPPADSFTLTSSFGLAPVTFQLTHPIQSLHTTRTQQPWLSSYIRYMGKQNHCSVFASVRNEMKSVAHIFCW